MINMRMANPPAIIARGTASQKEIGETKYIRNQSPAYGSSVFRTWRIPGQRAGVSYLATISRHAGWLRLAVGSGRVVSAQGALWGGFSADDLDCNNDSEWGFIAGLAIFVLRELRLR